MTLLWLVIECRCNDILKETPGNMKNTMKWPFLVSENIRN